MEKNNEADQFLKNMGKYQKINLFCSMFLKVNLVSDKYILSKFERSKRDKISKLLRSDYLVEKFNQYQKEIDYVYTNNIKEINNSFSLKNDFDLEYKTLMKKIGYDLDMNPRNVESLIYDIQDEIIKINFPSSQK